MPMARKPVANATVKDKMLHRSTVWRWGKKEDYKRKEGSGKGNAWTKVEVDRMEVLEEDQRSWLREVCRRASRRLGGGSRLGVGCESRQLGRQS